MSISGSPMRFGPACAALAAALLVACGGGNETPTTPIPLSDNTAGALESAQSADRSAPATAAACDVRMAEQAFRRDPLTRVVLVRAFAAGEPLLLAGTPGAQTPRAARALCLVKLNVGPGNPGPAGAPSTSAGIGIEVWLPARADWNRRIHALGGGGWQGGPAGSATAIAGLNAAAVAGTEGAVSSVTDTGHALPGSGAFAMNPDGTINTRLWTDFSTRAVHEQALKTKALTRAYYGRPARYAYWDGGSTGGRQGLKLAQEHPGDFDGIVALYPAIHWTRFITAELYPQLVYQRDLGGTPLSKAQSDLVSNAAIAACDSVGGQHLGYILDPAACRYDPLKDPAVLCPADGGSSTSAACVNRAQAQAINKIWYGMTRDGSAPDPALDNGWEGATAPVLKGDGLQRWFGLTRGTSFYSPFFVGLASPDLEFPIASDQVALNLQDASIAGPGFVNATGNGQGGWKQLSYAQLSNAYDRGVALQPQFAHINTDSPDLEDYRRRGGKILTWHGLADELIMPQGTINYYHRVAREAGGFDKAQRFYRLYLAPGLGHGTPNGTSNPAALIPNFGPTQFYDALTAWVEQDRAPGTLTLQASRGGETRSMPVCVYPKKISYRSGDPAVAGSYRCS